MTSLLITRKVGDREPVAVKVTYPSATDLAPFPVKFWMDTTQGAAKIVGGNATATDITPVGSTAKTVWRLAYPFTAADLDTVGTYKGEFEVDFGSGQKRYYPRGVDMIVVKVVAHPASN